MNNSGDGFSMTAAFVEEENMLPKPRLRSLKVVMFKTPDQKPQMRDQGYDSYRLLHL